VLGKKSLLSGKKLTLSQPLLKRLIDVI